MNRKADVTKAQKPSGQYGKHIRLIIISAVLFVLLAVYVHAGATLSFENWIYAKSVASSGCQQYCVPAWSHRERAPYQTASFLNISIGQTT